MTTRKTQWESVAGLACVLQDEEPALGDEWRNWPMDDPVLESDGETKEGIRKKGKKSGGLEGEVEARETEMGHTGDEGKDDEEEGSPWNQGQGGQEAAALVVQ